MENSVSNKFKDVFSKEHLEIIKKLNSSGYEAYFVGGVVRDTLLGIAVNDVDITTSATPEEVISVFLDYTVIPTGIDHGTVTVVYNREPIEITTFRVDGEYRDNRRPDSVEYTNSLESDLDRRDFTINAMAYNPTIGLIDLVGGVDDLENKVIKTVGNPNDRFEEDPLRIMRGLRFASKLGFTIDDKTEKAIFDNKHLLSKVSAERLQVELDGLLMGKYVKDVLLKYPSVISVFIPEVEPMIDYDQNNSYHIHNLYEHTVEVVANANNDIAHKLAALFHDIAKPLTKTTDDNNVAHYYEHAEVGAEMTRVILNRLKYPNVVKSKVVSLVNDHGRTLSARPYKIAKMIYEVKPEYFFELIDFKRADDKGKDFFKVQSSIEHHNRIESLAKEYLANKPILSHKDLEITPQDLMELGIEGKQIGEVLKELCLLAMSGHKRAREDQIQYVKRKYINDLI